MPYLLNVFYLLLLVAAAPWLLWQAVRKGKYREGYAAKFLGRVPRRTSNGTCVWLHAVSVGEVNLLAPLLSEIERRRPDWDCVVSTTTMTGFALARKKYAPRTVFYCPLDFSWAVNHAMRRVRPDLLVLAELELWPNLVRAAKRHGARVAVVNGRLSENSFRGYRRIRPLAGWLLRQIDLIAVQDETYAQRFRALGARPESVHVTGSMKYDGACTDRNNPDTRRLAELAGITADDVVLLAGSTQEPEEAAVLEVFQRLKDDWPRLKLVIVPRHPDRFDAVARLIDQSGTPWTRRSELGRTRHGSSLLEKPRPAVAGPGATGGRGLMHNVLLVDAVGELGAWWGTATIAFVGGSLGNRGGQNMIEPAAYGAAVSFGPNTRNFRDVVAAMLERDAAVVVRNADELAQFVRRCLEDPAYAAALGERARELVLGQLGTTRRTVGLLAGRACPKSLLSLESGLRGEMLRAGCWIGGERAAVMRFTKMHGAGNDYVYLDCFDELAPGDPASLARRMADRHFGVGGDGLVLICPSDGADARMQMFNADGSEAEMCGNALRCVGKYLYEHGICRREQLKIETGAGLLSLELEVDGGRVRRARVDMGRPILAPAKVPTTLPGSPAAEEEAVVDAELAVAGRTMRATCVSMGNPHCVTFVDELSDDWVLGVGPKLEVDPHFPNRVNAEFVQVLSESEVRMRVWERGSGETLACGTGACAVCVAGVLTGRTGRTILAHLPGGDLELHWAEDGHVFMTGGAVEVFSGEWRGMACK